MKNYFKNISIGLVIFLVFNIIPTKEIRVEAVTEIKNVDNKKNNELDQSKKEKKILKEIEEKREGNVKYFLMEDNTYEMAVYNDPVHYNNNGKWEEIDNNLTETEDKKLLDNDVVTFTQRKKTSIDIEEVKKEKNNVYKINKNGFDINIAKKSDSTKLINVIKDKYELSWNIEGINSVKGVVDKNDSKKIEEEIQKSVESKIQKSRKTDSFDDASNKKIMIDNEKKKTLTNISSGVKFKNAFDNIDLEYKIISDTVKENIIINNKIKKEKVEFNFNISATNLVVKQGEDKKIYFYDKDDSTTIIFVMESPFMYDSKGNESKNIELDLIQNNNGYSIKMRPDKEWINSKERAYPITIDPIVQTSQERSKIMDTFTRGVDKENKYNNMFLRVGNNIGEVCRSYIKFNIPALTSAETVVNAELALDLYSAENQNQINAHKVLSDWKSDSANNLSISQKPSYSEKIEDYANVSGSGNWQTFNITSIVKEWYTTGNNYGIMLKSNDEKTKDSIFWSADLHDAYTNVRPMIAIQYVSNSGLEDYLTYNSQSVGRAGNGYINDYNGNLVYIHDDVSQSGNRMPIKLSHIYNSNQKNNNDINNVALGYGNGWRLNLSQRIMIKSINNTNYFIYIDGDGTYHYFTLNSTTGKYEDELGGDLSFETNYYTGYDNGFLIKDKKGNKIVFSASGYLFKLIDTNDNSIVLSYENERLKYIQDGAGRITTLESKDGYLTGIIEPDNRKTTFVYDGTKLSTILYPDGKTSKYIYDSNNNLKEVENIDGYKIKYDYYDTGNQKVKKSYEVFDDGTLGKSLDISYGYNTTTYTDEAGKKNIYKFNDFGNTINIIDEEGNSSHYKYGADKSNVKNKLLSDSKLQKTTVNYLINHNAEYNEYWYATNDAGSTGNIQYSTTEKYLGNRSLMVSKTNSYSRGYFEQALSLEKGKTYTASAYIKTKNMSNTKGKGAHLLIHYKDKNGVWLETYSPFVNSTTDWQRKEVVFTVPADAMTNQVLIRVAVADEIGEGYFDCIQLEDGVGSNRYNLVENSSFNIDGSLSDKYWVPRNVDISNNVVSMNNDPTYPKNIDKYKSAYKIKGDANVEKSLNQTINVSGKKGDVIVVGGWAKASSVSLKNHDGIRFILTVATNNVNSGYNKWKDIPFNEDSYEWQYVSDVIVAEEDYKDIKIYGLFYKNVNDVYFDGIQVYKEEFGQSYQYDDKGNVISTSDLAKLKSEFKYDGNNNLVNAIDPKGNNFTYEYDSKKNIKKAITSENTEYNFSYDAFGNPTYSKVGDDGIFKESKASYTEDGNYMKSLMDNSKNTVNFKNNLLNGNLDNSNDAKGNQTSYKYDTNTGSLKEVSKQVDGQIVSNNYSYENDKLKTVGHNGFNYTFNYDKAGNTKEVKVGDKTLITNDYDFKTGLIKSSLYGNSNSTQFVYDENYRLKSKSFNNEAIPSFTYQYNNNGYLSRKYDNVNKLGEKYNYDSIGRLGKIDYTNNNSILYSYDNYNKLSSTEEKLFNKTYNTSYIYDKDNKYLGINYKADSINYSQNIKYDELNRVRESSYNNNGKKFTTSYNYGSYGGGVQYSTKAKNGVWNLGVEDGSLSGTTGQAIQLEAIKLNLKDLPAGAKIKYETHSQNKGWTGVKYDGTVSGVEGQNLRIEAMKIELEGAPAGYGVKYRAHVSERGWLPWQTNGQVAGTTGLGLGIEAIEVQIIKPTIKLSYSAKIKNGSWQGAVKDDELAGTTGKGMHIEALKLNVEGLPAGSKVKYETYSQDKVWSGPRYDGQVAGVENKNFMMEAVKISLEGAPKGYEIKYRVHVSNKGWLDWKKNGEVAGSITDGLGIEGVEIQLIRPGEGLTSINNNGEIINYTYDANGNIETIINGAKSIKYTYNELNEVVREDNQALNKTIVYKYDVGGNIMSKKEYGYTVGALGAEISAINYGYEDVNWKDKLTNYNGKAITYDQIGNPLTYDGNSYTWQNGRQLSGISGNGKTISYKYNDSGIRTEKTVNGVTTKYTLNGDKVIYEDNGTDKIHYTYSGTGLVSLNLNGAEYYYVRNAQNDIIGLIDTNGQTVVKYNYDTWGKLLTIEGSLKDSLGVKNPYRYRGYRYDTDTGLYYLNSRYYNAEWGRFINADSVGGELGTVLSHNMFMYCFNNPINLEDPSGCWPSLGQIFKAAAIIVATAITVAVVIAAAPVLSGMAGIAAGIYIGAGAMAIASTIVTAGCAVAAAGVAICGVNRAVEAVSGRNYGAELLGENNYNNVEQVVNIAAMTIGAVPQSAPYPSTAKKSPGNLNEQIALRAAQLSPNSGKILDRVNMSDGRMPSWMGWQKYSMKFDNQSGNIDVHYVGNRFIPIFFDFKIK